MTDPLANVSRNWLFAAIAWLSFGISIFVPALELQARCVIGESRDISLTGAGAFEEGCRLIEWDLFHDWYGPDLLVAVSLFSSILIVLSPLLLLASARSPRLARLFDWAFRFLFGNAAILLLCLSRFGWGSRVGGYLWCASHLLLAAAFRSVWKTREKLSSRDQEDRQVTRDRIQTVQD